ncbi:MAG TPA: hypothetical protein PKI61_01740 [bacterium]|nr:hypothetical protein [bacterium]HPT30149.1 hypothetical protein [bacterium]
MSEFAKNTFKPEGPTKSKAPEGYMAEQGKNEPRTAEWLERKKTEMELDEMINTPTKSAAEMEKELDTAIRNAK